MCLGLSVCLRVFVSLYLFVSVFPCLCVSVRAACCLAQIADKDLDGDGQVSMKEYLVASRRSLCVPAEAALVSWPLPTCSPDCSCFPPGPTKNHTFTSSCGSALLPMRLRSPLSAVVSHFFSGISPQVLL